MVKSKNEIDTKENSSNKIAPVAGTETLEPVNPVAQIIDTEEEFYTPEELAELLKVDYFVIVQEILDERNAGKYPIIQLKSNFEYRIPKSTFKKFISDNII